MFLFSFFPLFRLQESTFPKDYIYKGNYKGFFAWGKTDIWDQHTENSRLYTAVFDGLSYRQKNAIIFFKKSTVSCCMATADLITSLSWVVLLFSSYSFLCNTIVHHRWNTDKINVQNIIVL